METLNWPSLLPQLFLTGSLLGVLSCGFKFRFVARAVPASRLFVLCGLVLGFFAVASGRWGLPPTELLRIDGISVAWQCLFFIAALPLVGLMTADSEIPFALLLGVLLGMSLMAVANHLFLLFMGLEMMSLSIYMLLYAARSDARSLEAAMKYFFSGVAAAALYLFGFALYYAATGRLSLGVAGPLSPAATVGIFLMASAAMFKIGAFPLHFWLPDAYEAAPAELAGFMSTAIKAGGFLLLVRVLTLIPPGSGGSLVASLPWIAALTMTLGNLLALRQENLQRLLAYSSISHVGYMLAVVWASVRLPGAYGQGILYLYLLTYLFTSTGAFLFVKLSQTTTLAQLRGFGSRSPWLTAFMGLMLLSLAGVPPTAGFLAKFFVFVEVLRAEGWWLAGIIAVNSAVAMGYYFSILRTMTFDSPVDEVPLKTGIPWVARWTLWICAAGVVVIGLWPGIVSRLSSFLAI